MRLSEAIREGVRLRPRQCFGAYGEGSDAACAMGAARTALAGGPYASFPDSMQPTLGRDATCPECGDTHDLFGISIHLNDDHRWRREQIADWVSTIEAATP